MKRTRWAFGAVAVVGVFLLVVPAVGQGKANSASLRWSRSRGGAAITSLGFGAADGGSNPLVVGNVRYFRLGNSSLTKSGKLVISLTGSPAFSIGSDYCTGKSIGKKLSCWVSVAYAPLGPPTSDSAKLRATSEHGAAASVSLSGRNLGPSGQVYWDGADSGMLNEVSRGGGSATAFTPGQNFPYRGGWVVDGTNVYWVDDGPQGTVNKVPLGGGSVTTLASGQSWPASLAVDGAHVYWANVGDGTVNEVPLGGGKVTTLASGQSGPGSLAVDGTHVYWADLNYPPFDGTVNEVPVGGGPVTTLATGQSLARSVAVDGTYVYWVDYGPGTVNRVPIGGGNVTTLASGQAPESLAVEGMYVYWVDSLGETVNTVSVDGGDVTTLASDQVGPTGVAVDATHVYWVNAGDGTVNKVRLRGGEVITLARGDTSGYSVAVGP